MMNIAKQYQNSIDFPLKINLIKSCAKRIKCEQLVEYGTLGE